MPNSVSSLPSSANSHPLHAPRRISLGLQGGGTYGAFTWGVLDRLLDDERVIFDAISGTSAGAINAVVMADGMAHGGGRAGAQAALRRFWSGLSEASRLSPVQRTPLDYLLGRWTLECSPGYHMMQLFSAMMATVPPTPLDVNPARELLSSLIDFERVRACDALRLFIHATNVRTGKGRIFTREEIDAQRLTAAICLPQVLAAVEIDGEAYWDGSYVGNPALAPLVAPGCARDIVIVQINPVTRQELPRSVADINSRSNEIAFNISMMREVALIRHAHAVIDEMNEDQVRPAPVHTHLISGADTVGSYSLSSKYNTEWAFLSHLHELGFTAADRWLAENFHQIGVRSTLDPDPIFHISENSHAPSRGSALGTGR
ncbi:MAG TPA: patatin-like phospholipase family protein [Telluria sp.]|jgi:NTE family protein